MKHIKIATIALILYMHTGYAKISIQNLVNAPVDIQVVGDSRHALIFAGTLQAGELKIFPDNFSSVVVKVVGFKDNERKVPFTLDQDGSSGRSNCHTFWILKKDPKLHNGNSGYIVIHKRRINLAPSFDREHRAIYGDSLYYFFQDSHPVSRAYFGQPKPGDDFCPR